MRKFLILGLILLAAGCKSKKIDSASAEKFQFESLAQIIAANNLEEVYPEAEINEGTDLFAVSYTHLTLPTKRIV